MLIHSQVQRAAGEWVLVSGDPVGSTLATDEQWMNGASRVNAYGL